MSNPGGDRDSSIGEVATRLGIPISTLRWWEVQGLISASSRRSGRRRYTETDVRRIAMVQLWQTTAAMSLDEIRVFLAGNAGDTSWRTAVTNRIGECDAALARLSAARATLSHMLECPSDHPAQSCPYLGEIVDQYLDTGELPAGSAIGRNDVAVVQDGP